MIRLFLDTNILVSATFWEGSSYKLILGLIEEKATGFISVEILKEYRSVLKRDFGLNEEEVDTRIEKLLEILTMVSPSEKVDIIKKDPSDNRVLEGALEARAQFVISYDHHLLELNTFRGITIAKPEQILTKL